jgi:hypothetical protein
MTVGSSRRRRLAPVLLLAGALTPGGLGVEIVGSAQAPRQKSARMDTYDDLLVRVDEKTPGFGGMFIDADGRLVIYLLDTSQLAATRTAIEAVFGSSALPSDVRAVPGQYSVSQLKMWTQRLGALLEMPTVTMVDLDEASNRVAVGVADNSSTDAVEQRLSSLGVPRPAVAIEVTGEIKRVAPR